MTDFSFQLFSARNFPPLADVLSMVAAAGYKGVEGYGALYADDAKVAELKANLASSGLRMPTGHFALQMIEDEPGKVVEIARALGVATVYCPFLMPADRPSDGKGWENFGRRLAAAGAPLKAEGLGFGWHNHAFEFEKTPDGAIPQAAIFEGGPDLEWEADIAWVIKGGADPLEYIRLFGPRITAVHVKDIAPAGQNADEDGWADVGYGTVDWKGLMAALRDTPARNFVMEHDNPKDAKRFAERSIEAAKAL
ncbi:sugar phosphate isomerase/epimerase [Amaricoccus sp.]|uniref:sugar phosphate isomerase/epimerase family protein n=1 Tax=Amaricoccus sp. TaxID=1872485 RepID=UPI001B40FBD8|nr:sugar phosphate isomerase/epimerase [Amaricoccus sp.]MBP7002473.1 sugar phosphate isomerase/epimerase [Amaricoccus sp.]